MEVEGKRREVKREKKSKRNQSNLFSRLFISVFLQAFLYGILRLGYTTHESHPAYPLPSVSCRTCTPPRLSRPHQNVSSYVGGRPYFLLAYFAQCTWPVCWVNSDESSEVFGLPLGQPAVAPESVQSAVHSSVFCLAHAGVAVISDPKSTSIAPSLAAPSAFSFLGVPTCPSTHPISRSHLRSLNLFDDG